MPALFWGPPCAGPFVWAGGSAGSAHGAEAPDAFGRGEDHSDAEVGGGVAFGGELAALGVGKAHQKARGGADGRARGGGVGEVENRENAPEDESEARVKALAHEGLHARRVVQERKAFGALGREVEKDADEPAQGRLGRLARFAPEGLDAVGENAALGLKERVEERRVVAEVVIDEIARDARLDGHLGERQVKGAAAHAAAPRGLENALAALGGREARARGTGFGVGGVRDGF